MGSRISALVFKFGSFGAGPAGGCKNKENEGTPSNPGGDFAPGKRRSGQQADLLASCPQAASMSLPRERRTVTVMPAPSRAAT